MEEFVSQASSYVEGNMPGFPEMSCTVSIGFYNSIMKATTNCNKTPGGYETILEGKLKRGDTILAKQTARGTKSAQITSEKITGYSYGREHIKYFTEIRRGHKIHLCNRSV